MHDMVVLIFYSRLLYLSYIFLEQLILVESTRKSFFFFFFFGGGGGGEDSYRGKLVYTQIIFELLDLLT